MENLTKLETLLKIKSLLPKAYYNADLFYCKRVEKTFLKIHEKNFDLMIGLDNGNVSLEIVTGKGKFFETYKFSLDYILKQVSDFIRSNL